MEKCLVTFGWFVHNRTPSHSHDWVECANARTPHKRELLAGCGASRASATTPQHDTTNTTRRDVTSRIWIPTRRISRREREREQADGRKATEAAGLLPMAGFTAAVAHTANEQTARKHCSSADMKSCLWGLRAVLCKCVMWL